MKRCLKITVFGKIKDSGYRAFAQKQALALGIEGTIQLQAQDSLVICVCGQADQLDRFLDSLYRGTEKSKIDDLVVEPFLNHPEFRGTVRIIGN